ncbi:MAG: Na+/H+ antiporter [Cyclobacteriaceae bacterium]|jgi:CPA1 family monovalent cation:H+ antiporter|nr:Na+/H+ antiporter [Cyclobacteriaceae bacterium]
MTEQLIVFVLLLFGVFLLYIVSEKIKISYPILLVIAGLIIGAVPGMPAMEMDPDIVFFIFLPPLLYAAAWSTSWNDFWKWKRSIFLLAFGLVIFTSTVVAYFSVHLIPGFTLALGFLLGGIISPPDAVAATSVMKGLTVPKRLSVILEGESLINDASSLIIYRFAIAAVITGAFSFSHATGQFALVSIMGVVIGLAIANILYVIHRFLPTTPSVDTAITLISPYFCYLAAEYFHFSGVLSVVSAGLFLSWRADEIFNYQTRIQAINVWETLVFILNGVVFVLIGLQLPLILDDLDGFTLKQEIYFGLLISLLVMVIRMIWIFPGAYLPHLFPQVRKRETLPSWKAVVISGWSGMRGVVSLASALALPLTLTNGTAFPFRNTILFITFCVILMTLVVQGMTLPLVIRLAKLPDIDNVSGEEKNLRLHLSYQAIEFIESNYAQEDATRDALHHLKTKYEKRTDHVNRRMLTADLTRHSEDVFREFNKLQLQLINFERQQIKTMRRKNQFSDEVLRKIEYELDLEEASLRSFL